MKYAFNNFTLDSKSSELFDGELTKTITQKAFLLLKCLLDNPNKILSKEFLLTEVWQDRLISDNTIAQTVAQLRQIVEDDRKNPKYIITHRGRGISFTPEVTLIPDEDELPEVTTARSHRIWWVALALLLVNALGGYFWQQSSPQNNNNLPPNLLIYSDSNINPSEDWLQSSAPQLVADILNTEYQGKISTTLLSSKKVVNEYLDQQFQINPELHVIHTTLIQQEVQPDSQQKSQQGSQQETEFILNLDLTLSDQTTQSQQFTGDSVNNVLSTASSWLNDQFNTSIPALINELPDDPQVMELYMRGMAAGNENDYDKATQYFSLALTEQQDFHWARLQLAKMNQQLGDYDQALTLLDTLQRTDLYPQIAIQMVEIRGFIYDTQGRNKEAQQLFEQALKLYQQLPAHLTNPLRYELSYVLTNLNQLDQALAQLHLIEQTTTFASDPDVYAATLHKIASIQQSLGNPGTAQAYANTAIDFYLRLKKPLGAAKVHSLLARIHTFQSDYDQAKHHLTEALNITQKLDFKLGTGATINELVYILIREGNFDQAEMLNLEMQNIAIELGYDHMLIAAKKHATALAIGRKDWQMAAQYSTEQIQLATTSNNQTALMTAQFLKLEYLIEQGGSSETQVIIDWLVERIDPVENTRQHIALQLRRAQLLLINNASINKNAQAAIDLLNQVKVAATKTQNKEALVEINNTLATIYLEQQPDKSLAILKENKPLNPLAYPYLLLMSKALNAKNQPELSLEAALECKRKSGQHWQREDEAYLSKLQLLKD